MNIKIAQLLLRMSLAAGFLSAVADRFGLWGAPGQANVAWGSWDSFVEYVALLNPLVPANLIPSLGWVATIAEVAFALGLIIGWKTRWMAVGSALLLASFALAMTLTMGIKAPLDYSVFPAAAGALLLYLTVPVGNQIHHTVSDALPTPNGQ
ncbi:MAG: DoxX family protein [Planctomycetes bacterium]|nr:DoxX family protein [Planctomycetota bacterium]